jgi:hypothetical protein
MVELKLYNSKVHSIFSLIGKDENALTYALGYVFKERKDILISFLKEIGVLEIKRGASYSKLFTNYIINLQQYNDNKSGIKDITIEDSKKNIRIVIEAKIDDSIPSKDQIKKYYDKKINLDWESYTSKYIIILTRREIPKTELKELRNKLKRLDIILINTTWSHVYKIINHFGNSKSFDFSEKIVSEIKSFLMEDYKVKYFENEVLCRKVTVSYKNQICNDPDIGYYFDGGRKSNYFYPSCLFFCACSGKKYSDKKNANFLRRIAKYEILSSLDILSSRNKELISAFEKHKLFFPIDSSNNRLHVFKLTDKITIPVSKQNFNSADLAYKEISELLN